MVAAGLAAAGIEREFSGGEDVLPGPGAGGARIFSAESEGKMDGPAAAGEVVLMKFADAGEVGLERLFEPGGQEGDALAHAFAFADADLVVAKIDVFNAKAEGFQETQATAVKEMNHEAVVAFEMGKDGARFGTGEDDGELGRAADAFDPGDEGEFAVEHLTVKKEEGAEGLILGGGGDGAIDGEMTEEGGDLGFAHGAGMAFAVEEDEAANPIEIRLFGTDAVVFDAEVPADAVEELRWRSVSRGSFSEAIKRIRMTARWLRARGNRKLPPLVVGASGKNAIHRGRVTVWRRSEKGIFFGGSEGKKGAGLWGKTGGRARRSHGRDAARVTGGNSNCRRLKFVCARCTDRTASRP